MKKLVFILLFFISFLKAQEVLDEINFFSVKTKDITFKDLYLNLKDEINFNSYIIVHELDLAKSTKAVASALDKKAVVKNGKNILICKSTLTLQMHEENIHNMTFCPMIISVYEDENYRYASFKKYHPLEKDDFIALKINQNLKKLILKSLD